MSRSHWLSVGGAASFHLSKTARPAKSKAKATKRHSADVRWGSSPSVMPNRATRGSRSAFCFKVLDRVWKMSFQKFCKWKHGHCMWTRVASLFLHLLQVGGYQGRFLTITFLTCENSYLWTCLWTIWCLSCASPEKLSHVEMGWKDGWKQQDSGERSHCSQRFPERGLFKLSSIQKSSILCSIIMNTGLSLFLLDDTNMWFFC